MDWKSVQELRKQGNIAEGKRLAYELLEADARDFRTRSMLEWLIYDEAKPAIKNATDAVKADKRPQQADLRRIDQALTERRPPDFEEHRDLESNPERQGDWT